MLYRLSQSGQYPWYCTFSLNRTRSRGPAWGLLSFSGLCIRDCMGALSKLLFGMQQMSPFGILLGLPGKPPFRRRVPLVLTGLTVGTTLGGSSHFTGVNRGGGGGGFGFLRTVRIADGWAGGLMSGALACTLIFSMLEAVVPLELLLRVSVLELSVISSSSCRSEVRVSIWSTTWRKGQGNGVEVQPEAKYT